MYNETFWQVDISFLKAQFSEKIIIRNLSFKTDLRANDV